MNKMKIMKMIQLIYINIWEVLITHMKEFPPH
jgi:hypothetical protein